MGRTGPTFIEFLSMWPEARRQAVRLLGEIDYLARRSSSSFPYFLGGLGVPSSASGLQAVRVAADVR
jgi:hypothetical protein